MNKHREDFEKETGIPFRPISKKDSLIGRVADYIEWIEQKLTTAEAEVKKSLSYVRGHSIPETRAKTLHHAIEVLISRMQKEISFQSAEIAEQKSEYKFTNKEIVDYFGPIGDEDMNAIIKMAREKQKPVCPDCNGDADITGLCLAPSNVDITNHVEIDDTESYLENSGKLDLTPYSCHGTGTAEISIKNLDPELNDLVNDNIAKLLDTDPIVPVPTTKTVKAKIDKTTKLEPIPDSTDPEYCEWTYDDLTDSWDSACGEKWQFIDGGPIENHVRFCQGCGKPIKIKRNE